MRVTTRTMQESWTRNLQTRLETLEQLNRQIGTGVRIQRPADDPAGAARVVRLEEVAARHEQYLRNIAEALSVGRSTESALDQAYQHLVRVKALAVEGASDASAPLATSFAALASEVAGIKTGLLQIALSRNEDRYLFAGTAGEVPPFEAGGGLYRGDSNVLRVNAGSGQTVAVNLPGDLAFREPEARSLTPLPEPITLAGDLSFRARDGKVTVDVVVAAGTYSRDALADVLDAQFRAAGANLGASVAGDGTLSVGIADTFAGGELILEDPTGALQREVGLTAGTKNVFGLLDDLAAALGAGDSRGVGAMLGRIDRALDAVLGQRGLVGARSRNLELARDRLEGNNLTNQALRSEIEGVDLPRAVMRVSAEEQAYQTALASGARIFNVSILDFLR